MMYGDTIVFGTANQFLSNTRLYCLNHGLNYSPNNEYFCYERGSLADLRYGYEVAYIVANQTDSPRSAEGDLEANAIWVLVGEEHATSIPLQGTSQLNALIAEAEAAVNLQYIKETSDTQPGLNISISGPSSPAIENAEGKYGPFKINYPTYMSAVTGNEELVGDGITITVNGTTLSYLPKSGVDFYLTEADGIKYGEENIIEVKYQGSIWQANGHYAKFTPKRTLTVYAECEDCGAIFIYEAEGWVHDGEIFDIEPTNTWVPDRYNEHNDEDCTGRIMYSLDDIDVGRDTLQNLIYIYSDQNKINEIETLEFWAGKPEINIDLNKVNPKNQQISGVEFNVTVEGGKLETANGSASATISGNSSFKIVPTAGTNKVRVTLEETKVPEDYVKFTTPIIIEYDWNGTEWVKNIVQLPQGVTEGKSITVSKTGTTRQSTDCSDNFEITIVNRPVIRITLNKKDPQGNSLENVIFDIKVDGGTARQSTIKDRETVIIEPTEGQDNVKVTLKEQDPGEEFVKYEDPIEMNFNFDGSGWNLGVYSTPEEPENVTVSQDGENKVLIKAVNRRKIIVNLYKTDNAADPRPLSGMIFDVNVTAGKWENANNSNTITTDENGYAEILIIPDGTEAVTLKLKERDDIYYINPGEITIKFEYKEAGGWQPTITTTNNNNVGNISINGNIAEFDLKIENIARIEDLTLVKINKYFPDEKIKGVEFLIEFTDENGKNQNVKTRDGNSSVVRTTNENGEIEIGELIVLDPSKEIYIKITEKTVPDDGLNYKGLLNNSIILTLEHKKAGCEVSAGAADKSLIDAKYKVEDNVIEVVLQNEVTLDLSGRVWEDGQTGIKPVLPPNGLQDNIANENNGIAGIEVSVKTQGNTSSSGVNGGNRTTVTGANGKYEFKDLPASTKGNIEYYIEFTYDGINYIVTTQNAGDDTIDSDVTDENRAEFNNKFHTITKNTATHRTNGQTTTLEYNYDATTATLITKDSNGNVKSEFKMKANTLQTTYSKNTENIDMGLVKRGVNLAAFTDIEKATVSINGKTKEYNYNDISQIEETDEDGNLLIKDLEIENKQYNLFLYNSDYNYRIGDYKLSAAQTDSLAVNATGNSTALQTERENAGELNVEVTYQVLLNNRSATNATINEFAYYYDQRYELIGVQSKDAGYNIVSDSGNKLVISGTKEYTDTDNQSVLELTFMLKKDNNGSVELGKMQNWVEITSYSTDEGCIDINSAPDNMQEHNAEDDTDDAPGLVVQLNNLERQTSGYVFEDSKSSNEGAYNTGNGLFDSGEKTIDDVIIQLIEIKNVTVGSTTLRLEYIWQETVSGSSTVRYITSDGQNEDTYNVINEPGQYTFNMNIIPGDYIVRFIYGDNTYWDTAKDTANLLKYNGQDYKSTIDIYYDKAWYVDTYYEKSSMARDNEARRLEQITYARNTSETNATELVIDSNAKLNNTWMCAETSAVWTDIAKDDGSIKGETHGDSGDPIKKGINFGLVGRPRAVLVLEKHLTRLYIEGLGESYTNMQNYAALGSNGGIVNLDSNGAGVISPEVTNKTQNQRGKWHIETEASTIAGNELSITYSYTVKNIGDLDYIGESLSSKIIAGVSYDDIASEAKNLSYIAGYIPGAYLGAAYYNGSVTTPGQSAASIPFQIEDYMSTTNGLQIDESGDFKVAGTDDRYIWSYDSSKTAKKDKKEHVNVIQTDNVLNLYANERTYIDNPLTLRVYNPALNSTSGNKELVYRSYAAQLIYPTTGAKTSTTGILSEGMRLQNLETVQSYVEIDPTIGGVSLSEFVPEPDEFVAETVIIRLDLGADKQTPTMLIITITAGLAVMAVGIVLIKKFIIK